MKAPAPILLACCGNAWAGDDAFGPLVAEALRHQPIAGVEVVDLGTGPASLLDHLGGRQALMLVDAAVGSGAAAGQLLECDWDAPGRPPLLHQTNLSSHSLSLADQIALARQCGLLPPVVRLLALEAFRAEVASLDGAMPTASLGGSIKVAVNRIDRFARMFLTTTS